MDLTSLIAAIPQASVLIGADGRIRAANGAARDVFGASVVGQHFGLVIRHPALRDRVVKTIADGQRRDGNDMFVQRDVETHFAVTVAAVALHDGQGVLITLTDTSSEQHAAQVRRDFIANVSHELRTPLTALSGFIETLQGAARNDTASRDRFLSIMANEAARMNRLVKDLLSLSRVEADERKFPVARTDLALLVRNAINAMGHAAAERQVSVLAAGVDEPCHVRADADQMTQILHNLIENAIKYGGRGKTVTVDLSRRAHDPRLRGPAIRLAVSDQGDGIDPEHLPRLTERFYRVDTNRSRAEGGTGLGLAIVKHIVNRHRGRLNIESTRGAGSTFEVLLPDKTQDES